MQYHLEWPDELQAIERKFLDEIERWEKELHLEHAPTFITIIEKRIAFLDTFFTIIEKRIAFLDIDFKLYYH
jgi:hypothetical protein